MHDEDDHRRVLWRMEEEAVRNLERVRRMRSAVNTAQGVLGIFLLSSTLWSPTGFTWLDGLLIAGGLINLACAIRGLGKEQ